MSIRVGRSSDTLDATALEGATGVAAVEAFLRRATALIVRHESLLDRLDAALGDGDHGTNMAIGLRSVVRSMEELPEPERPGDVGALLRHIGHGLVESVGGASGPLYGTAFIEAGFFLGGVERLDVETLADAFEVGTRALARRGRCEMGDKTILDALGAAAEELHRAADRRLPLSTAFRRAAGSAAQGMRATIPLVARRGLALRLGERSRGHRDPGATSCFLLVLAMASADRPAGAPS